MKSILIYPFNGNGREAVSVLTVSPLYASKWKIIGFVDDDPSKKGLSFSDWCVLGGQEVFEQHPLALVLAVPGRPESFHLREKIIDSIALTSSRYATVVDPSVFVGKECTLGHNILIMANVVLTSKVSIGSHTVILPNTVISHESRIGDYCLIGSNVSIAGSVTVGRCSYIATGASIRDGVHIGERALVGMGSVVLHDVPDNTVVAGCPSRPLRPVVG